MEFNQQPRFGVLRDKKAIKKYSDSEIDDIYKVKVMLQKKVDVLSGKILISSDDDKKILQSKVDEYSEKLKKIKGEIDKIKKNEADINQWKLDEFIHRNQSIKFTDIKSIVKPVPQKRWFGLISGLKDDDYLSELEEYNRAVEKVEADNTLFKLFFQVKKKQNFNCGFCGFRDERYLEIHHIDGDHQNNTESNLLGACTLCHRQHHLLWLSQYDHGRLGVFNNDFLTQTDFNHLQRICLVFANDAKYQEKFGVDGKLGQAINQLGRNFDKPLHAFLQDIGVKKQAWDKYVKDDDNKLVYNVTEKKANYNQIALALTIIHKTKNYTPDELVAKEEYDNFINMSEEINKKANANMDEQEIRNQHVAAITELLDQYDAEFEKYFEKSFSDDTEKFSLFELAISLAQVDYSTYMSFKPKNLFLIFNQSIFSEEQIEYYKKLDYFNVDKWNYDR